MAKRSLRILLLSANYTSKLSYYDDWTDAFVKHPSLETMMVNICGSSAREEVQSALKRNDFVVLLHSTNGDTTTYLERVASVLADRSIPLLSFVGNEVNLPSSPISEKRRVLKIISPEIIASQLMIDAAEFLWGDVADRKVSCVPHALNHEAFQSIVSWRERTRAIGVVAARYSVTLGDNDRNRLHDLFSSIDRIDSLPVVISSSRLSRQGWSRFLNESRATVSTEAGSWFLERDDATVRSIVDFAKSKNNRSFTIKSDGLVRRIGHKMPWSVRQTFRSLTSRGPLRLDSSIVETLDHDEIHKFFFDRNRPDFYGKCISSRHFDAVGTGTVQVLLQGRYNDCLNPGEHYLELRRDFTNLDEVLESLRDEKICRLVSEHALNHVLANHTYRHRVDKVIAELSAI